MAAFAGTGAWSPITQFPKLAASGALRERATTFAVLRFYLLRPARLWRHLHRVLPGIMSLRLEGYGNYEPSSGLPPRTLSRAFGLWTAFHENVLTPGGKWIVFALGAWPMLSVWLWIREPCERSRRRIEILTLLPVCCLAALITAVFGDAFDLVRRLFLFHLMLDASVFVLAAIAWRAASSLSSFRLMGVAVPPVGLP
jgi:hypothetical protein